jgi:hypothetical protein
MKRSWSLVVVLLFGSRAGLAQQFQQVGTGLPGPVVWTEGAEAFDANGDGKPDVLFANGIGFSTAGGPLAPTLLINQTTAGPITFADETAARLPAGFTQQAKGLVVTDVDNDGDADVAFANGFGNQPSLLINNGTGVFTNETATRFPVLALNSFGGGFGDVDDDGDIDLVFADAGPSAFGAPGGTVRLFVNNGAGVFANTPLQMNAANKVGSQNAQLADVDNDFDLDVIVDGKSSGQQLYLNNGAGTFTLQAATLPAGTGNTYATDFSDLDNDNDLDAVYISFAAPLNEGTAQNGFVPSGTLGFTGSQTTIGGLNGHDDNDVVFVDADNDGIQDAIVGSLTNNQEKLYRNAGTFADASFAFQATGFTMLTDSTLDLATADFDLDGRYDVVTGQGESGNFTNRVYRNTGLADTRPPRIGRVQATPPRVPLSVILAGGFARKAWIQDATYKRGQTFVRARADVSAIKDGVPQSFSTPMRYVGGGLHRAAIQPAPSPTGRVGMDVTWSVHATDPQANASDSPPATFRICGAEPYGQGRPNSTGFPATLAGVGDPALAANNFSVTLAGLPPNRPGVLLVGTVKIDPASPFRSRLLFIGGTVVQAASAVANGAGNASIPLDFTQPPFAGAAPGSTLYIQFRYEDSPIPGATNALEVVFCD